ncbi:hypothetical protein LDENG_00233220 [Lucifuga dentata]|nr:hypothetical protein LDENG_00233220 [Lucifuga dentata]
MPKMKAAKPLFLMTYGKQKRKLTAWISPDNRKQAFESSECSTSDISLYEPEKPRKTRKRTSVGSVKWNNARSARLAKTKAMAALVDKDSDEESISIPTPDPLHHTQKSKAASGNVPPIGRFVTHRQHAAVTKPKLLKGIENVLNSSDDFTSSGAAAGSRRIRRPPRKKPPSAFNFSSAENSVDATGTASIASNPFREISLNESAGHSLRKPLFCSTPSASSCNKHLKHLPFNHQSPTALSISVSSVALLSTFQEDVDCAGHTSPPHSTPPMVVSSGDKQLSNLAEQKKKTNPHHLEESSGHLFIKPGSTNKSSNCREGAKSQDETTETQNGDALPMLKISSLISTDTEGISDFVSASGELQWLIEAQKEKCLTRCCTVQLERVDKLMLTQLHSQTTYSSCLEHSSSVHSQQTKEHSHSVKGSPVIDLSQSLEPSLGLHLSVTNSKISNSLQSENISANHASTNHVSSSTVSQNTNLLRSAYCNQSAQLLSAMESSDHSSSVIVDCIHHADSSVEFIRGSQSPTNSHFPKQLQFADSGTEEVAEAVKDKCLAGKIRVQLNRLSLSQLKQQKESGLTSDGKSVSPDVGKSNSGDTANIEPPAGHTHSRTSQKRGVPSVEPGPEEKTDALTAMLKEECLRDKSIVGIKRLLISQLTENSLQLEDFKRLAPRDVSNSSEGQTVKMQSKSNHTATSDHHNQHAASRKKNMKKRPSTSFEKKASDKEKNAKTSLDILPKRKKVPPAPKEKKKRSTSTDRPATSRKANVSGLSVSRWKNKVNTSTHTLQSRTTQTQRGNTQIVDCSFNDLTTTHHKNPKELCGTTMKFSTPAKAKQLNLSSLLAELTPNTHTWSRFKAALSVHRKVLLTPKSSCLAVPGSSGGVELGDISRELFATPLRTPMAKNLQSQLLRSACGIVFEDADLSDAEKVYAECGQQGPLPWEECILPQRMKQCVKIGEGTFGEVFSTTNASGDTVALKVIPVEGSEQVNGEDQKTFGEILHEIIISKELSSLKEKQQNQIHSFIGLNDLHCVQGCYPPAFLKAWDTFDEKKGSENDRPDFFEKEQLFLILEFEFGGGDLENSNGMLSSLVVAKSILHQVTAALAVAEQELHFEHRDLHWGNVLVKTTKDRKESFLLNGTTHSVETKGVLVRIIDYSLSRVEIDGLTVSCDISKDDELFMGQGDYQFEIYRLMRQENGNDWSVYQPHSNVLWLHYLCSKLLSMKYQVSRGRGAKDMRKELTRFYDNILQYRSATEALQNCPMFQ